MGGWTEADGIGVYICEDLVSFSLHTVQYKNSYKEPQADTYTESV